MIWLTLALADPRQSGAERGPAKHGSSLRDAPSVWINVAEALFALKVAIRAARSAALIARPAPVLRKESV